MNIFKKLFIPPEYPSELPSKAGKLAYFYHWHMYLVDTGRGHVFGKFEQLIGNVMMFILLLDKMGYARLTLMQMIIIASIGAFLVWFSGWVYIALKLDIVRGILSRYRDVMFRTMHNQIKELRNHEQKRK